MEKMKWSTGVLECWSIGIERFQCSGVSLPWRDMPAGRHFPLSNKFSEGRA
jgi:hypothetical protein